MFASRNSREDISSFSSFSSSSSSIGTTAQCGLWPVEQCPSIFFLSATNSLHLLTPSTGRSLSTYSLCLFLGLPLLLVPSSYWVKIFFAILSSSIPGIYIYIYIYICIHFLCDRVTCHLLQCVLCRPIVHIFAHSQRPLLNTTSFARFLQVSVITSKPNLWFRTKYAVGPTLPNRTAVGFPFVSVKRKYSLVRLRSR